MSKDMICLVSQCFGVFLFQVTDILDGRRKDFVPAASARPDQVPRSSQSPFTPASGALIRAAPLTVQSLPPSQPQFNAPNSFPAMPMQGLQRSQNSLNFSGCSVSITMGPSMTAQHQMQVPADERTPPRRHKKARMSRVDSLAFSPF